MTNIYVLILNYYGSQDTIDCVQSVLRSTLGRDKTLQVVVGNVFDQEYEQKHESTVHTERDALLAHFGNLRVIDMPNKGFAANTNTLMQSIHSADSNIYVWLNNDTIIDKNALEHLAEQAKKEDSLVCPKIYFSPGSEYHRTSYSAEERGRVIWYVGGLLDRKDIYTWHKGVDEVDFGQHDQVRQTAFATGCCVALSQTVWNAVGTLSEDYFMYYEDVDYSLRADKKGIRCLVLPSAVVYHKNAGSSGSGSELHVYYQTRNRLLLAHRWGSWRSKLALNREAKMKSATGSQIEKAAVRDWQKGRFGKRVEHVN